MQTSRSEISAEPTRRWGEVGCRRMGAIAIIATARLCVRVFRTLRRQNSLCAMRNCFSSVNWSSAVSCCTSCVVFWEQCMHSFTTSCTRHPRCGHRSARCNLRSTPLINPGTTTSSAIRAERAAGPPPHWIGVQGRRQGRGHTPTDRGPHAAASSRAHCRGGALRGPRTVPLRPTSSCSQLTVLVVVELAEEDE
jgi:hypothetical protein